MVSHAFEHGQHSAGRSPATNLSLVGVGRLKWGWWSRTQEPTDLQTLAIRCGWEDSPKHVCSWCLESWLVTFPSSSPLSLYFISDSSEVSFSSSSIYSSLVFHPPIWKCAVSPVQQMSRQETKEEHSPNSAALPPVYAVRQSLDQLQTYRLGALR